MINGVRSGMTRECQVGNPKRCLLLEEEEPGVRCLHYYREILDSLGYKFFTPGGFLSCF
jgi:hypothetical protein